MLEEFLCDLKAHLGCKFFLFSRERWFLVNNKVGGEPCHIEPSMITKKSGYACHYIENVVYGRSVGWYL